MWILIPSFEPDSRLVELVRTLLPHSPVLVIDDGSGPAYAGLFDNVTEVGGVVVTRDVNQGKGEALRIGFEWLQRYAEGEAVVCADSDGQHRVQDILRVGAELSRRQREGSPDAVVLGARSFVGDVPVRSRLGNRASTALVSAALGRRITDTQTGLRGYPPSLLSWAIGVRGERFAYELRLLLDASKHHVAMVEVPIQTVYLENNKSSHFRPVVDTLLVLAPLLLFGASSVASFAIDAIALLALNTATGSLAVAVLGARLISGSANFALNRRTVFRARGSLLPQVAKYIALAAVVAGASYFGLLTLTGYGLALLPAKILTDLVLWFASFGIQRRVVFSHPHAMSEACAKVVTPSEETTWRATSTTSSRSRKNSASRLI
ncbi:bifunctional glycosyltransferase family 2/GtrA family protein [Demequina oxidasica]|uniref:bifunctional glycosyltransferase family 2/GtrA family protein n=1 Tax=Demequina oxidasica TaxID=676199 RepID=UPI000783523D|nr:bifunctional glycosyltransferase family 2/GtrA family protein [Demequina oxidasica]